MQLRLYNFESFEKSIDDFRLPKEDILAKKKKKFKQFRDVWWEEK